MIVCFNPSSGLGLVRVVSKASSTICASRLCRAGIFERGVGKLTCFLEPYMRVNS